MEDKITGYTEAYSKPTHEELAKGMEYSFFYAFDRTPTDSINNVNVIVTLEEPIEWVEYSVTINFPEEQL